MSARRASVIDALRVATIPLQARPPTCDRESANDGRIGRATSADPKLDHGHPHQSPSNLRRILGPAAYRPVRRSIEPPPIDPGLRAYRRPGMCRDLLTFGDLCRGRQHCEVAHSLVVDGVHTAVTRHGFAGSGLPCKRCPASTPAMRGGAFHPVGWRCRVRQSGSTHAPRARTSRGLPSTDTSCERSPATTSMSAAYPAARRPVSSARPQASAASEVALASASATG